MSGQTMEITGYIISGVSAVLLILSEVFFRVRKRKIIDRVYEHIE